MFSVAKIKKDFPIFKRLINNKQIIYLDSAASSLKPQTVLNAVNEYYSKYSVNIFRGIYKLSEEATAKFEDSRKKVADFIGCRNYKEIVFVRNATEAINLVVYAWGRVHIDENSEIISTVMEHHANIVPWQQLALETGATLKFWDFNEEGFLDISDLDKLITKRTKILVFTYVSNVLGTINPVKEIVFFAKKKNPKIKVLIDAAQAVPHLKVDVVDIGCDFLAFSGHKMLGPTGIGVLWGKFDLLSQMLPFQMGGEMIREVSLEKTIFNDAPYRFEAGTPHIAGVIGLGAALDYLESVGLENIRTHEKLLVEYTLKCLSKLNQLNIYGPSDSKTKGGVVAFNLYNKNGRLIHPHDVAQILDRENIYIRSGHHCAMPLHKKLGVAASCRASFYLYNSQEDVNRLVEGLERVKSIFL